MMRDPNENGAIPSERSLRLAQGIEWMLRMGYLDSPDVQTALTANIYAISDRIQEVSLVADTNTQRLLAYLRLSEPEKRGLYRKFLSLVKGLLRIRDDDDDALTQEEIGLIAEERLRQVLQDYELRVVFDEGIYRKSKEISEKIQKLRSGIEKKPNEKTE